MFLKHLNTHTPRKHPHAPHWHTAHAQKARTQFMGRYHYPLPEIFCFLPRRYFARDRSGAEGKAGLARAIRVAVCAGCRGVVGFGGGAGFHGGAVELNQRARSGASLTPTSSPPPPPSTQRQLTTRAKRSGWRRRGFAFGAPAPPRPTDFARTDALKKPAGLLPRRSVPIKI